MRLLGPHQGDNASAALVAAAVLKRQGFHRITLQAAIDGLAEAALPGRFQVCRFAPPDAGAGTAGGAGSDGGGGSGGGGWCGPEGILHTRSGVCGVPSPREPW